MNFVGLPRRQATPSSSGRTLALSGKSVDVPKVIAMIDEMLTFLGQAEHGQDDCDKAYCDKSFDQTGDEAKVPARQFAGYRDAIKDYQDQPSCNDVHSEVVQTSSSELDASVRRERRLDRNSAQSSSHCPSTMPTRRS